MKSYLILTLALSVVCANVANAGLKIYYIRHAEGGHNVKSAWEKKDIPKSEWPAYVGDANVFTPKGLTQVVSATEKLQNYDFDFIASSPLWRVRHTIAPFLRVTNNKAEVWPELREGPGMRSILSEDIPEMNKEILNKGRAIVIPKEEADIFSVRSGVENNYIGFSMEDHENEKVAYMKHVTLHAISLIEGRFGGTDQSILIAGHNSAGVSLLKLLLQEEPSGKAGGGLSNTGLWMVEQQEDGSYELMMFNDKPYTQK